MENLSAPPTMSAPESDYVSGTVVCFNPQKGFGFINLGDGPDAIVGMEDVVDGSVLAAGQLVQCTLKHSGRGVRAVNVITMGAGVTPGLGSERASGTVVAFNPQKGFGFIGLPDRPDAIVGWEDVADGSLLAAGQQVECTLLQSAKGIRAVNVTPLGGPIAATKNPSISSVGDGTSVADSNRVSGTVVSFFPQKGFGFINFGEGPDAIVGWEDVADGSLLAPGQLVECTLLPTAKGYRAINVTVAGGVGLSNPGLHGIMGRRFRPY
eukprot:TRINITY_DN7854_c0_g1_i2.p1 TRINITY_DN7854_c0_g1~~TRINITY_DN7854_c0_g1_i2.p1  ORF type:complete len:266 (+),score=43.38 TRINITY_DN7854_c0_g1_i2:52-849(+)